MSLVVITSCGDDDEQPDPIIGLWELDDVNIDAEGSEFDYVDVSGLSSLFGETSHTIEFRSDMTYQRTMTDVDFADGVSDFDDPGEWTLNGEDLVLDSDNVNVSGMPYSFTINSIDAADLVISYVDDSRGYFPQSKIDEWFEDGTIDAEGFFTGTAAEVDSIFLFFLQQVSVTVTLEYEK